MFVLNCVMLIPSLLVVGLRFYCRKMMKAGIGWDDGLILVAAAMVVALFSLSLYLRLSRENQSMLSLLLVFEILYLIAMCLAKLSAICLYMRIFIQKRFQLVCKVVGAITTLLYIAVLVEVITLSEMASSLRQRSDLITRLDSRKVDTGRALFDIFGDFIILLLPIRPIWMLQMRVKTKISLTILFSLGICVFIVSCIRLSTILKADPGSAILLSGDGYVMHFHVFEPELAVFSLCLPTLRPLWVRICQRCGSAKPLSHGPQRSKSISLGEFRPGRRNQKYCVEVSTGAPEEIQTKKGLNSLLEQKFKLGSAQSGSETTVPQKTAQVTVKRTWEVSYEAAAITR